VTGVPDSGTAEDSSLLRCFFLSTGKYSYRRYEGSYYLERQVQNKGVTVFGNDLNYPSSDTA